LKARKRFELQLTL